MQDQLFLQLMNFLAPQFLYGLLAISIPIIIHLFNFRKSKKIYFSSNRYLRKVNEETSSKRNLKHLLILLMRIGFITFLVIAFARPFIPAEEKELQNNVQIYLDNSFSMSNEYDEDLPAFDHAISIVNGLVDEYPQGTGFRLITNDFMPFSNIFRSGEEIKELLTELTYSKITREASQIRERLRSEEVNLDQVDNYWISDFQTSIYGGAVLDSMNVRMIPIRFNSNANIFIDSVYTETPFLLSDDRISLFARLVNRSDAEIENLNLKVFINDIQVSTNSITIPPRGVEITSFDLAFSLEDSNPGRITIEDFPVIFDNDFYFILKKFPIVSITEIRTDNSSGRLQQVYGNRNLFDFRSFQPTNLDYSQVTASDLVIINGIREIDNSLSVLLTNYLDAGGSIAIIPSSDSEIDSFGEFLGVSISSNDSSVTMNLQSPDFRNPFFSDVFEDQNPNMKMPSATKIWSWYNDRDALLRFANGQPFLSKISRRGSIYIFSTPFETEFTDFTLHALFVPVMYKMAITGMESDENIYLSLTDSQFEITLDSVPRNALLKLRNSNGEIIPQQRFSGDRVIIEPMATEIDAGIYDVILNDLEVEKIALNNDKRESLLTQQSTSELGSMFDGGVVEIFDQFESQDDQKVLYAKYQPTPLWKYALLIAVLFLVGEVMIFKLIK